MSTKKTWFRAARGFSLVELLLVMTLLPIVFFAVYSNLSTGINLWQRVVRETPEEDMDIFYTKTRKDLLNMQRFSLILFDGDKEQLSFASTVTAPPELGGESGMGRVRIYYDSGEKIIFRESQNYSQAMRETEGDRSVLLKGVDSFELSYFSKETMDSSHSWSDSWKPDPKRLPAAVKITFSLEGSSQRQDRTVFIPAGGVIS